MKTPFKVHHYSEVLPYLANLKKITEAELHSPSLSMARARLLLKRLGNPQDKFKSIHLAGTSGKGTTAMMSSALLSSTGATTGLLLSPHVYDIRERFQINNQPVKKSEVVDYLNQLVPVIEEFSAKGNGITYFEAVTVLGFMIFADKQVEYAVIETGVGGLWDFTNTINRPDKVAVITRIGKDHTHILGKTISAITTQKAGIIRPGNHAIALWQSSTIRKIINEQAKASGGTLEWVKLKQNYVFAGEALASINPQFKGEYQAENLQMATRVFEYIAARDNLHAAPSALRLRLSRLRLPGRLEVILADKKTFILDGAHNQQKLDALLKTVASSYSGHSFGLILALRSSKKVPRLSGVIQIIATEFIGDTQDMPIPAKDSNELAAELRTANTTAEVIATKNVHQAITFAKQSKHKLWVVSGSFFLLAEAKALLK